MTASPMWERLVVKYMTSIGIPGFSWDAGDRRFHGVKGFSFVRITPRNEGGWARLPEWFKRYERQRTQGSPHPVVMLATSRHNGPRVEDSYVVMRLSTYGEMLKDLVTAQPARYLGKD